jgi:GDPmannose 4,6-dehydratase
MKALILGANGQDGFYLTQLLQQNNYEVIGVSRHGNLIRGDVGDFTVVQKLIASEKPDFIFHLAAASTTKHSALFENHSTIVTGSLNILETVYRTSLQCKVFLSGSGLQFQNKSKPIKESDPFETSSAYAMSRIQSVYAARYYRSLGVKVYVGYFFNHDSPRRAENHMTKKIAEAAKRIGVGSNEKLEIGNIDVIKEYGYAPDIVEGIWTLVNQEKIFEANISTGKGYSIKDWLEECFKLANKNWKDYVAINKDFVPEYKQLVSDPSIIFSLGWQPKTSFSQLAKIMMQYWS